jgi:hypothetical protein
VSSSTRLSTAPLVRMSRTLRNQTLRPPQAMGLINDNKPSSHVGFGVSIAIKRLHGDDATGPEKPVPTQQSFPHPLQARPGR